MFKKIINIVKRIIIMTNFKIKNYIKRLKLFLPFTSQKRKINVGSAYVNLDTTWVDTDIDTLNITKKTDWYKFLLHIKLDNIMAEHVWEHLSSKDAELANKNCFNFLKKGGILRIAVPDGFHPNKKYIDYVKPNGCGSGSTDHKILYNYKTMKEELKKVGFKINLLEYWDENGMFHYLNWSNEAGKIDRSKRYDERNQNGELAYTSLIVDAIKP